MTDSSTTFRPSKQHVIALVLMTGIALIGISWAPLILGWLLLIPLAWLLWIFTASTTISEQGIALRYVVKPNVTIAWSDLSGIAFQGARAKATTQDGKSYAMPGVTFNMLPELAEASRGRITDVITQAQEAADGKYEIINKDGNKVLMSREAYDEYVKAHPDLLGPRPEPAPRTKE
ncbi:hypothetical protein BJP08_05455 [Corynebacterium sp. NML140438]|uniref:PH domain-containing protein n=1 Tax=Corynebacterium sp. NML140438 TaxID=1906334 RepID=UPI0008FB7386|nr:PH domain-containing protein [Corynebacterium sp. NML140438]OIR42086.1 hypothetical protein BJP08_05455 [Corynebacterium sp. NML140438]